MNRPGMCDVHWDGRYQASLTCPACRRLIKDFLWWGMCQFNFTVQAVGFTGSSGAAFGYWLADEFGIQPLQVFKPSETRHGGWPASNVLADPSGLDWIFLDDFVGSGATYRSVVTSISHPPKGALCYMPCESWDCPDGPRYERSGYLRAEFGP